MTSTCHMDTDAPVHDWCDPRAWIELLNGAEQRGSLMRGHGQKAERWPLLQRLVDGLDLSVLPFDPTKSRPPGGTTKSGWQKAFNDACREFFGGDFVAPSGNQKQYYNVEMSACPVRATPALVSVIAATRCAAVALRCRMRRQLVRR